MSMPEEDTLYRTPRTLGTLITVTTILNTNIINSNIQPCRSKSRVLLLQPLSTPGREAQATVVSRTGVDSTPCTKAEAEVGEVDAGTATDALLLPNNNQHSEL